jgi:hypothetical protein
MTIAPGVMHALDVEKQAITGRVVEMQGVNEISE